MLLKFSIAMLHCKKLLNHEDFLKYSKSFYGNKYSYVTVIRHYKWNIYFNNLQIPTICAHGVCWKM